MAGRAAGARAALVLVAAWLAASGCVAPGGKRVPAGGCARPEGCVRTARWHERPPFRRATRITPLAASTAPLQAATDEPHGPPAPGIYTPPWLPRAGIYWDGALRYRFFAEPKVGLDQSRPSFTLGERPLVAGRIGFKINVDGATFASRGGAEDVPGDVALRRGYLVSSGVINLPHPLQYNLEFGILQRNFYLDSAWLGAHDVPWVGSLKLGGLDAPIGFDNVTSSRDRAFMELPAPVQAFVPATSLGLLAHRTWRDGRASGALGWFTVGQRRDVGDQSRALARVVARGTWLARDREQDEAPPGRWPELVHLGIAGSYTFAGSDDVRYQSRPESFLAPVAVDTGRIPARSAFVLGAEGAARRGPLSVQAEALSAFVDHRARAFPGLYLSAAYLLTGEVRPYDREGAVFGQVVPTRPLGLRERRFGAAELAGRWSWVDLEDGDVRGGRMHVLGAGFNWYWNRWVRWQANYELALADGGPLDGRLHVFQARFQLVL
ncbi:MAG: hypothetical protein IT293_13725 [Deltaproteobacteria bacterium]|nr:hypothetical protein [Deltaproteobacteria bacterium]